MSYSQFIHGKIAGERSYKVVALTADLVGREEELESIAQKYRFWGQQPPSSSPIAVGVFHDGDGLLLAQAMSATHGNGQAARDIQGRPFSQHRYVFLPAQAKDLMAGRLWLLLNWIMEETRGIPIFDHVERNLPCLSEPPLPGSWYNPTEEIDKLRRALQLQDKNEQPVLLSSLAALINGKRVIFDAADTEDVFSEDLLEGVMLLLPALCRSQVAVAAGAIDETVCTQANLMVKTNGSPKGPLGDDLVWAKRANNQFFGSVENGTLRSEYTNLLQPIIAAPDSLNVLVRILDGLNQIDEKVYQNPWQALHNGWAATRLIPAMPDPAQRAKYWQSALRNLSAPEWRHIIPSIIDETGLEIAWTELQKASKRQPDLFAPLVFELWSNFSEAYINYVLQQELPQDLKLAEILLTHGLLNAVGPTYRSQLLDLSLLVTKTKARKNKKLATDLAQTLLEAGFFSDPAEQFAFKEAVFLQNPQQATELAAFFRTELAPVLPQLSTNLLLESDFYQTCLDLDEELARMLEALINKQARAVGQLPDLANHVSMNVPQTTALYTACLAAWQPTYAAARPLLTDLVTRWIADYPPEERPPVAEAIGNLGSWLDRFAPPEIGRLLSNAEREMSFEDWHILAQDLFDTSLGQVSFMDHVTIGQPVTTMAQQWLLVLAKNKQAKANFEVSYTWDNLQEEGPSWLAEAVAQLLGWQETSLSALLPVMARVQSALNLPQALVFKLLEAVPRQGNDNIGLMLAAYLPGLRAEKETDIEEIPLWQILAAQAPKVAQVYKILAEDQKNVAVDMFNQLKLNSALSEAPEYAEAMAHWLQLCGKGRWISGRLLETIIERWDADHTTIDANLLTGMLQLELTEQYGPGDWLALARICWLPDYQSLWPLSGQTSLNIRQRAQALSLATNRITGYSSITQTERLLVACRNWGFTHDDLAELAGHAPQNACNFHLLNPYLYVNGSILTPHNQNAQNLLALALRLKPTGDLEKTQMKSFITNLMLDQLKQEEGVAFLANWHQVVADTTLFQGAITDAVLHLAPAHFSLLVERARQLKRQGAKSLSLKITSALDQYWSEEKDYLKG